MLGIILGVYFGSVILLNIPYIQRKTTVLVAKELSTLLETRVNIEKINIGLLNRIIIDDLLLEDQSGAEMLKVSRLSAKFNIFLLFRGEISISSVQLFGFNVALNKLSPDAEPNFKFVIDAFSSKDSIPKNTNLDLRINSLLIRRGKLSYDVLSEKETPGRFNPGHIKLYNIIGNVSLKSLTNDSINAQIKRFSVDEQSGLELRKLSMKLLGNAHRMSIENFEIDMPDTSLRMDTIHMSYDSLGAFNHFITDVQFSMKMLPSYVTLQDISPFISTFTNFKEKINLEFEANGTINQLNMSRFFISAGNNIRIRGGVSLTDLSQPENIFIFGNLSHMSINSEGIDFLVRNLTEAVATPQLLKNLGDVSFNGEVSGYFTDLVTYGIFRTALGIVNVDVKLSSDKEKGIFSYSGRLKTDDFEFGQWLDHPLWGKTSFNIDINSTFNQNLKYPSVVIKGLVSTLEYSDYAYNNITLDGEYKQGGFDGKISLDDENGSVLLNGNFNLNEQTPTFNFFADIKKVNLHELHLTPKYKDCQFSLKLRANFVGGSIDDMIGSIDVDSVLFEGPDKRFYMDNMHILSTRENEKNKLSLRSEIVSADIEGNYSYRTLPASIENVVKRYTPSLFAKKTDTTTYKNDLSFDIRIYNTDILPTVFDIPLNVYSHSTFKGYFNDNNNRMRIEGYFPKFRYDNAFYESGMMLLENSSNFLKGRIRFSSYRKSGTVNVSLDIQAQDDVLITRLNWGNNATTTYSGHFMAESAFSRTSDDKLLKAVIDIKPTDVILNDTIWKIRESKVVVDSGRIHIDNFMFHHADQHLNINGYASENPNDTIKLDLKEINIDYVFDILQFKAVDFKGSASGRAFASGVMKNPVMNTQLFVRNFSFNDGAFGDMNVFGEWNQKEEGIYLRANIKDGDIGEVDVDGYIYPLRPKSGLDLDIKPRNANLKFLEFFVQSIMSDIKGRASGRIHLYGPFSTLNLEGNAKADATFKVNVLNTYFALKDSVHFEPERMYTKNAHVSDLEGHLGQVTVNIYHQHFKDMKYRLEMNARNMLIMHTVEEPEMPFYGTIYATGSGVLTGDQQELRVNAAITTNRNTNFAYTMAPTASAASNQFIKFVDKTPNINLQDSIVLLSDFDLAQRVEEEDQLDLDVHLNLQIDATPDATIKIIMDPVSDDFISAKGVGNIRMEYFNKGDVKMFGNYNVTQGVYKFSLQEVIRKNFLLRENGSVTFSGDPFSAQMDVQAVYTVNSASLTDLVPSSVLTDRTINRNVRVNCLMNLSGPLFSPTVKLDIELPNSSSETQNLVRNYIRTDEDVNMQTLYLLAIGKFYTPDYVATTQNSNMMTSVLSSTLSGQLNRILSQIIDNNNWVIGTNLSTGERGWTDTEFVGMLSGQLLNNRLLVNGNFGYRDNPLSNTNFVGDFDAEWLLTRSGDLRLKAYNETNDQYYTRSNLTTQGVGIIFRKDFDKWRYLFSRRRRAINPVNIKKLRTDTISTGVPNDSIPLNTPGQK